MSDSVVKLQISLSSTPSALAGLLNIGLVVVCGPLAGCGLCKETTPWEREEQVYHTGRNYPSIHLGLPPRRLQVPVMAELEIGNAGWLWSPV